MTHTNLKPGDTFRYIHDTRAMAKINYIVDEVNDKHVICYDTEELDYLNKQTYCFPAPFWKDKRLDKGILKRV